MRSEYTQAFLEIIRGGMPVAEAILGLKRSLARKNHTKLLAPILREALRRLETDREAKQAVVSVGSKKIAEAQRSQITAALNSLGVKKDTAVVEKVEETLIGGFVVTYDYQEYDKSYKNALKSLYESITK